MLEAGANLPAGPCSACTTLHMEPACIMSCWSRPEGGYKATAVTKLFSPTHSPEETGAAEGYSKQWCYKTSTYRAIIARTVAIKKTLSAKVKWGTVAYEKLAVWATT